MARSRHNAEQQGSRKQQAQSARSFARDLEGRPDVVAGAFCDLLEGVYGEDLAATGKALRTDPVKAIYMIGVVRWGISRDAAGRALANVSHAARERVKRLVREAFDKARPPIAKPSHDPGTWRASEAFTGGGVMLRARSGAAQPSAEPRAPRAKDYKTPKGMFSYAPGVYGRKI